MGLFLCQEIKENHEESRSQVEPGRDLGNLPDLLLLPQGVTPMHPHFTDEKGEALGEEVGLPGPSSGRQQLSKPQWLSLFNLNNLVLDAPQRTNALCHTGGRPALFGESVFYISYHPVKILNDSESKFKLLSEDQLYRKSGYKAIRIQRATFQIFIDTCSYHKMALNVWLK